MHARYLVREELRMVWQPRINLIFGLTPITVLRRVLAVGDRDYWVSVLRQEIIVFDGDVV